MKKQLTLHFQFVQNVIEHGPEVIKYIVVSVIDSGSVNGRTYDPECGLFSAVWRG